MVSIRDSRMTLSSTVRRSLTHQLLLYIVQHQIERVQIGVMKNGGCLALRCFAPGVCVTGGDLRNVHVTKFAWH